MPDTVSVAVPLLVNVTVWAELLVPGAWGAKVKTAGEGKRVGNGPCRNTNTLFCVATATPGWPLLLKSATATFDVKSVAPMTGTVTPGLNVPSPFPSHTLKPLEVPTTRSTLPSEFISATAIPQDPTPTATLVGV